jgi:hypothetical protein
MTRISTRKSVDVDYWRGRLEAARAFRKAAEDAIALAEPGANANPAISQMVLAAIAYGDCLTAKRANVINFCGLRPQGFRRRDCIAIPRLASEARQG